MTDKARIAIADAIVTCVLEAEDAAHNGDVAMQNATFDRLMGYCVAYDREYGPLVDMVQIPAQYASIH